ncbi:MAG: TrkA family potassium uptake protein [Bacillota bacterium]|nr:TrkA family potassium uptake protein [Bacillota bacterium]
MRIIIVGGGKLAYYLIKMLRPYRHEIVVIDEIKNVCENIANEFENIQVFLGDGTNMQMLANAGSYDADFYVAATGNDENNLIGCEIAKKCFNIKITIARVNNPKNAEMFYRMGVDRIYSGTQILADIIEQVIDYAGMRAIFSIDKTSKRIVEFKLSRRSSACGKPLQHYRFPGSSRVVVVIRQDSTVEMPHGNLVLQADDTILLICDENEYDIVWRSLVR